ncbi:unnamed protein product [Amoebophrya sp. A120]|nr:unnamed protein product [Amoebophrya sp. A120]|eukprot:GSA120T00006937001.1
MSAHDVVMKTEKTELPEGYHKEDTLFIFDWDDTILPTTWLALNELRVDMPGEVPQNLKAQLDDYAPWAMRTLEEAKKYGKVLIVTNAEDGWIELTIKKFFPSWEDLMGTIPYHSARSTWEPTGCTLPVEWKVRSFDHEIRSYYDNQRDHHGRSVGRDNVRRNIIGLGDSTSDREAMLHVTGGKANTTGKSLKFMERPNLEHLQKQHHLIASSIRQIALHEKSLDLCIQHQMESNSNATSNNSKNTTAPAAAAGSNPVSNTNEDSQKTNDSSATIPPPTDSNNSEAKKDSASCAAKADNTGSSSNGGPANPGIGGGSIPTPQSGTANAQSGGSSSTTTATSSGTANLNAATEMNSAKRRRWQVTPSLGGDVGRSKRTTAAGAAPEINKVEAPAAAPVMQFCIGAYIEQPPLIPDGGYSTRLA